MFGCLVEDLLFSNGLHFIHLKIDYQRTTKRHWPCFRSSNNHVCSFGNGGCAGSSVTTTAFATAFATAFTATASAALTATSAEATATAAASVTASLGASRVDLLGVSLEPFSVLSERGLDVLGSGPEVWGEELVGVGDRVEAGLDEVLGGTGGAGRASVHIIDTSELQDLLGDGCGDDAGTAGSGGQLEADGAALAGGLGGDGVDLADLVAPVASPDGNEGEFGANQGALDGDLDLLGKLDAEADVPVVVTDDDDGLEAGPLTGLGLLLDGDDLHDLVGERALAVLDELVDDGGLLDGDRVGVDFLEGGDVSVLDETAELGLGNPVVLAGTEAAGSAATAATTATTTSVVASATTTEAATASAALCVFNSCWCFAFHLVLKCYNNIHSKFV